jgi:general secretion pathway protein C
MNLLPKATMTTDSSDTSLEPKAETTESELNVILQSNIFDASNRIATASFSIRSEPQSQERAASVSRSNLTLIGTVVSSQRSMALLQADGDLQIHHLGEKLPGGGTLEDVQRNHVVIRNPDQTLSTLHLHDTSSTLARPASTQSAASEANGIREVGTNRWLVDRSVVESVRENFASQLRLAQMHPRLVDGKTSGFIIQRIYPRSILSKMGLQRSDIILQVNSMALDSPEKALQIFQQLREARQINVALERNGQPLSFVYEIE